LAAFPITAVDTLGAGDTFHGAFSLALVEGSDTNQAMRFAAAAAALKCTRFGGISGTPTRSEVDAFLAHR
jgi:sugar/nucleoside kinase (ribokinase family)